MLSRFGVLIPSADDRSFGLTVLSPTDIIASAAFA